MKHKRYKTSQEDFNMIIAQMAQHTTLKSLASELTIETAGKTEIIRSLKAQIVILENDNLALRNALDIMNSSNAIRTYGSKKRSKK